MRNCWSSFLFVWFLRMYTVYTSSGNRTEINTQINSVLIEVLLRTVGCCSLVYTFDMIVTLIVAIVNY